MERIISYRRNIMRINSIDAFLGVKGGFNNGLRDVYFVRAIGENAGYLDSVRNADQKGMELSKAGVQYLRLKGLPHSMGTDDAAYYSEEYGEWAKSGHVRFRHLPKDGLFQNAASFGLKDLLKRYQDGRPGASPSMIRNFGTKILFWADTVLGGVLKNWNERSCVKVIAEHAAKEQEYLFFYFATLLGCDVLLLENKKEADLSEPLKSLSQKVVLGPFGTSDLPDFSKHANVTVSIPKHMALKPSAQSEKSFEELAGLASSVVMIAVHDNAGEVIGTGSGIMIGRAGYILTNNHVVSGGRFYSVRMEDDEEIYPTDEIIKYNYNLDLAIIRIQKELIPIPIYQGKEKLVRGQKVVAIGSPLGLFNSVSDGIISGFRVIKDVNMIQFTAPISPGSSGGAVLNMKGEVIGISTAGMDNGQNLNLAVSYGDILGFTKGFL